MIAAIVRCQHTIRDLRVANSLLKVDKPIECATSTNPLIDCSALCLTRFRVIWPVHASIRCQSGTHYLDSLLMSVRYQRFHGIDDLLSRNVVLRRGGCAGDADVVYPLQQQNPMDASLAQSITIEAR